MKEISWKSNQFSLKKLFYLYDKTQFHMVKSIINAFDHMEFCLVIDLTVGGYWAVIRPPIV